MLIDDLKEDLEKGDMIFRGICHDCGKHVEVSIIVNEEGEIVIDNGSVYQVKQGYEKLLFFKCEKCFDEDHTLRNWKRCEVYSRVVDYLRPVQQWNKGKVAEWDVRKEFVVPGKKQ